MIKKFIFSIALLGCSILTAAGQNQISKLELNFKEYKIVDLEVRDLFSDEQEKEETQI